MDVRGAAGVIAGGADRGNIQPGVQPGRVRNENGSFDGRFDGCCPVFDGRSILAAACEQKSVLLFDPGSRRLVKAVEKAHQDCVNCVRFLDSRTFATCSDDTTVALWDARYLKGRLRTLRGHSNWVKNIEYSRRYGFNDISYKNVFKFYFLHPPRENYLVTSGFDGAVYVWDINRSYSDEDAQDRDCLSRKVFNMNGLMRMRLSAFADRMVVSTMNGFLMVIHDLKLDDLEEDLANFKVCHKKRHLFLQIIKSFFPT